MNRPAYETLSSYDGSFSQEKAAYKRFSNNSTFNLSDSGRSGAPLIQDDSKRSAASDQNPSRRLLGWRAGVTGVTALVICCLLLNVSFLIWAVTSRGASDGVATLQEGNCQTSANLNTGIHLVINLLSTGMLSGSNYCMQRLAAPTRREMDEAHRKHRWLDIGVPSFRNLFFINKWRTLGWLLLATSSLPLHLFYNSAVFAQISATTYSAYIVDPSFLNGAPFNASKLSGSFDRYDSQKTLGWLQNNTDKLTNLSTAECITDYAQQMQTSRGHVLAVTLPDSTQSMNNSLLSIDTSDPSSQDPFGWLCQESSIFDPCTLARANDQIRSNGQIQPWVLEHQTISYCLSQPVGETCELQFSSLILAMVIICNFVKCVTMLVVLWKANEAPLITIGDCITSCLQVPDDNTAGMCLLDKRKVTRGKWRSAGIAQHWDARRRRWFAAASEKRWIIGTVTSAAGLIFTGIIMGRGMNNGNFPDNRTIKGLWSMGFGAVNMATLVVLGDNNVESSDPDNVSQLLSSTLLSNTPQLILSILYFSYNSVFTCELISQEWNDFGRRQKPLRVTWPVGVQKSTYWLNLPYKYGLPLMVIAVLLHWLFSRAIFLVNIHVVNPMALGNIQGFYGNDLAGEYIMQCGWSPSAVIVSIIAAGITMIVGLLFGFRRYRAGPPLVGSCSAAIAAACHREPSEDADMVFEPLKWGVTSVQDGVGHCTFSAREVERPSRLDVYR